ncbi:Extracellular minor metalloprotease precursor [Salmonella enterica subsp. arizonae]|uniref:Neutral metalloproteinase n=1 Tax=Salmonella enterica subsp. arizonae TaxID=59203 RepID=A0A2X4T502_SALER|nr:Extracellular minor metalloprotease precursor [Salmonella enterica subsp. arizonae]
MVFGDGDGEIFNRFTSSIDVVAHELTHGVTETEAGLIYFGQSGALNESLSDVFGSLVKQFHLQQTAGQADWIIGEGLLAKGINGKGLRSMAAPGTAYDDPLLGKDPQPAHMQNFIKTREDNGGVHLNSGIPNRAFIWPPAKSAVMPGKKPVMPGMIRCAIAISPRMPVLRILPDLPSLTEKNAPDKQWLRLLSRHGKP